MTQLILSNVSNGCGGWGYDVWGLRLWLLSEITESRFRFVQQVSRQAGGHACETDLWEGRRSHTGGVSLDAVDLHGVGPDIYSTRRF